MIFIKHLLCSNLGIIFKLKAIGHLKCDYIGTSSDIISDLGVEDCPRRHPSGLKLVLIV